MARTFVQARAEGKLVFTQPSAAESVLEKRLLKTNVFHPFLMEGHVPTMETRCRGIAPETLGPSPCVKRFIARQCTLLSVIFEVFLSWLFILK